MADKLSTIALPDIGIIDVNEEDSLDEIFNNAISEVARMGAKQKLDLQRAGVIEKPEKEATPIPELPGLGNVTEEDTSLDEVFENAAVAAGTVKYTGIVEDEAVAARTAMYDDIYESYKTKDPERASYDTERMGKKFQEIAPHLNSDSMLGDYGRVIALMPMARDLQEGNVSSREVANWMKDRSPEDRELFLEAIGEHVKRAKPTRDGVRGTIGGMISGFGRGTQGTEKGTASSGAIALNMLDKLAGFEQDPEARDNLDYVRQIHGALEGADPLKGRNWVEHGLFVGSQLTPPILASTAIGAVTGGSTWGSFWAQTAGWGSLNIPDINDELIAAGATPNQAGISALIAAGPIAAIEMIETPASLLGINQLKEGLKQHAKKTALQFIKNAAKSQYKEVVVEETLQAGMQHVNKEIVAWLDKQYADGNIEIDRYEDLLAYGEQIKDAGLGMPWVALPGMMINAGGQMRPGQKQRDIEAAWADPVAKLSRRAAIQIADMPEGKVDVFMDILREPGLGIQPERAAKLAKMPNAKRRELLNRYRKRKAEGKPAAFGTEEKLTKEQQERLDKIMEGLDAPKTEEAFGAWAESEEGRKKLDGLTPSQAYETWLGEAAGDVKPQERGESKGEKKARASAKAGTVKFQNAIDAEREAGTINSDPTPISKIEKELGRITDAAEQDKLAEAYREGVEAFKASQNAKAKTGDTERPAEGTTTPTPRQIGDVPASIAGIMNYVVGQNATTDDLRKWTDTNNLDIVREDADTLTFRGPDKKLYDASIKDGIVSSIWDAKPVAKPKPLARLTREEQLNAKEIGESIQEGGSIISGGKRWVREGNNLVAYDATTGKPLGISEALRKGRQGEYAPSRGAINAIGRGKLERAKKPQSLGVPSDKLKKKLGKKLPATKVGGKRPFATVDADEQRKKGAELKEQLEVAKVAAAEAKAEKAKADAEAARVKTEAAKKKAEVVKPDVAKSPGPTKRTSGTGRDVLGKSPNGMPEVFRPAANPVNDIQGNPTGWVGKRTQNGYVLVHPTEDRYERFEASDPTSGTETLRARKEARAYAIDNPVEAKKPEKPEKKEKKKSKGLAKPKQEKKQEDKVKHGEMTPDDDRDIEAIVEDDADIDTQPYIEKIADELGRDLTDDEVDEVSDDLASGTDRTPESYAKQFGGEFKKPDQLKLQYPQGIELGKWAPGRVATLWQEVFSKGITGAPGRGGMLYQLSATGIYDQFWMQGEKREMPPAKKAKKPEAKPAAKTQAEIDAEAEAEVMRQLELMDAAGTEAVDDTTPDAIAKSNFDMAVDQWKDYGTLKSSFESFGQNTYDSAIEAGLSQVNASKAVDEFWALVDRYNEQKEREKAEKANKSTEQIEAEVMQMLKEDGKASLTKLAILTGVPKGIYGDPMSSRLNQTMKRLVDEGKVVATKQQFGEPDFSLPKPKKTISKPKKEGTPKEKLARRIAEAARKEEMEVRPINELKGDNGKWYRATGFPLGVKSTGEKRTIGYGYVTKDGVGVGKQYDSEQVAKDAQKVKLDREVEDFYKQLMEMSDEEIGRQQKYWLKEEPVKEEPVQTEEAKKPAKKKQEDLVRLRDTKADNWREEYIQNVQEQFGIADPSTKEGAATYTLEKAIELIRIVNSKSGGARNLTYEFIEEEDDKPQVSDEEQKTSDFIALLKDRDLHGIADKLERGEITLQQARDWMTGEWKPGQDEELSKLPKLPAGYTWKKKGLEYQVLDTLERVIAKGKTPNVALIRANKVVKALSKEQRQETLSELEDGFMWVRPGEEGGQYGDDYVILSPSMSVAGRGKDPGEAFAEHEIWKHSIKTTGVPPRDSIKEQREASRAKAKQEKEAYKAGYKEQREETSDKAKQEKNAKLEDIRKRRAALMAKTQAKIFKKHGPESLGSTGGNVKIDLEILKDVVEILKLYLEEGTITFAGFVADMAGTMSDVRDVLPPYLSGSWKFLSKTEPALNAEDADVNEARRLIEEMQDEPSGRDQDDVEGDTPKGDDGTGSDGRGEDGGTPGATGTKGGGRGSRESSTIGNESRPGTPGGEKGLDPPAGRDLTQKPGGREGSPATDFNISTEFASEMEAMGNRAKFDANIAAMDLLNNLKRLGLKANAREQEILAKQTGWGQFAQMFKASHDLIKTGIMVRGQDTWNETRLQEIEDSEDPVTIDGSKEGRIVFRPNKINAKGEVVPNPDGRRVIALIRSMSPDQYEAARESTQYSHYTSPEVARTIWDWFANQLGNDKRGIRFQDPASGNGIFFGVIPQHLKDQVEKWGVDPDLISLESAKQLYQTARLDDRYFQDIPQPDGMFDFAALNPPFADQPTPITVEADKKVIQNIGGETQRTPPTLHNAIILKQALKMRKGGVMAVVVTHNFMDKLDPRDRQKMKELGMRFVGAVRLPNTTFAAIAGTQVTTDVIFFQKGGKGNEPDWLSSVKHELRTESLVKTGYAPMKEETGMIPVNNYFINNPQNVIGELSGRGSMYALSETKQGEVTVHAGMTRGGHLVSRFGRDEIPGKMSDRMSTFRFDREAYEAGYSERATEAQHSLQENELPLDKLPQIATDTKVGNLFIHDNALWLRGEKGARKSISKKAANLGPTAKQAEKGEENVNMRRARAWLSLRDLASDVYMMQRSHAHDMVLEDVRAKMKAEYKAFVREFGFLNASTNVSMFAGDWRSIAEVLALEVWKGKEVRLDKKGKPLKTTSGNVKRGVAYPSQILDVRTSFPPEETTSTDDPLHALQLSLQKDGKIDIPYIAGLLNIPQEDVMDALGDTVYVDPQQGLVTVDEYLSGNIRDKLRLAEEAAVENPVKYERNVAALKKTKEEELPDLTPTQIKVVAGSAFIPSEYHEEFIEEVLGVPGVKVEKNTTEGGGWLVDTSFVNAGNKKNTVVYGVEKGGVTGLDLWERAMNPNSRPYNVRDENGNVSEELTLSARKKKTKLEQQFQKWVKGHDEKRNVDRGEELAARYNELMNSHVERKPPWWMVSTQGLTEQWANDAWKFQRSGAARMMLGNTMLEYVVGAGKTLTFAMGIMNARRLGLWKKPVLTAPKHLTAQHAGEIKGYYPDAQILVATSDDFTPMKRQAFINRVKTGNWDLIIIPESSFNKIPMSPSYTKDFFQKQLDEIEKARIQAEAEKKKAKGEKKKDALIKKLEAEKLKMKRRMNKMLNAARKDPGPYFDQLGVDSLVVDEAQGYKNLWFKTDNDRVPGINSQGNQKTFDMLMKTDFINEISGAKNITFATATPVTNSLAELYVMQRYLQPGTLKRLGIENFDDWHSMFGDIQSVTRVKPIGSGYRVEQRFNEFINVPELHRIWSQVADIKTQADLNLDIPELAPSGEIDEATKAVKVDKDGNPLRGRIVNRIESPPMLQEFMMGLAARSELMDKSRPDLDNILKVMTDGAKAAVDMRLLNPNSPAVKGGKIDKVVENVKSIYDKSTKIKGAQVVWLDRGVPRKEKNLDDREKALGIWLLEEMRMNGQVAIQDVYEQYKSKEMDQYTTRRKVTLTNFRNWIMAVQDDIQLDQVEQDEEGSFWVDGNENSGKVYATMFQRVEDSVSENKPPPWNAYEEIKKQLVLQGVPESEVRFIHDAKSDTQKADLYADVNSGDCRVIIASTLKMGTGANIQKRLIAAHHVDAPWRPSDLEQRDGRILRQKNKIKVLWEKAFGEGTFPGIEIHRYVSSGTIDARYWDTLEQKQVGIESFKKGDRKMRTTTDWGETAMSMADVKAEASQNPLVKEEVTLRVAVHELQVEKDLHEDDLRSARNKAANLKSKGIPFRRSTIKSLEQRQATFEKVTAGLEPGQETDVVIDGKKYKTRAEAAEALHDKLMSVEMSGKAIDMIEPEEGMSTEMKQRHAKVKMDAKVGEYYGFPIMANITPGWYRTEEEVTSGGNKTNKPRLRSGNTWSWSQMDKKKVDPKDKNSPTFWEWGYAHAYLTVPGLGIGQKKGQDPSRGEKGITVQPLGEEAGFAGMPTRSWSETFERLDNRIGNVKLSLAYEKQNLQNDIKAQAVYEKQGSVEFDNEEQLTLLSDKLIDLQAQLGSQVTDTLTKYWVPSQQLITQLGGMDNSYVEFMIGAVGNPEGGRVGLLEAGGRGYDVFSNKPVNIPVAQRKTAGSPEVVITDFPPEAGNVWIQPVEENPRKDAAGGTIYRYDSGGRWAILDGNKIEGINLVNDNGKGDDQAAGPQTANDHINDPNLRDQTYTGDEEGGDPALASGGSPAKAPTRKNGTSPAANAVPPAQVFADIDERSWLEKNKLYDMFMKVFAPSKRSTLAMRASNVIRKANSKAKRASLVVQTELRSLRWRFAKMSEKAQVDFIERMEHGRKQATTELDDAAKLLRTLLNAKRDEVHAMGKWHIKKFIQHYFPHIWQKKFGMGDRVKAFFSGGKLEGSKAFMKQRKIPTISDGLAAGLIPVSYNPADLVALKLQELERYVVGQTIFKELKDKGLIRRVYGTKPAAKGMFDLKDDIFTIFGPGKLEVEEAFDSGLMDQLAQFTKDLGIKTDRVTKLRRAWGMAWKDRFVTKFGAPESVFSHELGHVLGYRYDMYNTITRQGKLGKKHIKMKKRLEAEWTALANLRLPNGKSTQAFQKHVQGAKEKEAVLVHAYIHAPVAFENAAPKLFKQFEKFLNKHIELQPLMDIEPTLVLGTRKARLDIPGTQVMGRYVAPEIIATLVNNHLSPGLRSNENEIISGAYNFGRRAGNLMNQAQLSISLFHASFTTISSYSSQFGQAVRNLAALNPRSWRRALKQFLTLPIAAIAQPFRGAKLWKMLKKDINTLSPDQRLMVEAFEQAGGSVREEYYWNNSIRQMRNAIGDILKGDISRKWQGAKGAFWNLIPSILEGAALPILGYLVPAQKLGMFAMLAQDEMERLNTRNLSEDKLQLRLAEVWDSVDNRLGQLVYDNEFWNKTLKDSMFLGIRAVGWNRGFLREYVAGPFLDVLNTNVRKKRGDQAMSLRQAEMFGTVVMVAVMGAIITWVLVGMRVDDDDDLTEEEKEELKKITLYDMFFPRTGRMQPNGSPERWSTPTYAKDLAGWYGDLFPAKFSYIDGQIGMRAKKLDEYSLRTAKHKLHPMLSLIADLKDNRDFFGTEIWGEDDTWTETAQNASAHVGKSFIPFAVRNFTQALEEGMGSAEAAAWSFTGSLRAPHYVADSQARTLMNKYLSDRMPKGSRKKDEFDESRLKAKIVDRYRQGKGLEGLDHERFTDKELLALKEKAKADPFERALKPLSAREALNVYMIASGKERDKAAPVMLSKVYRELGDSENDEEDLVFLMQALKRLSEFDKRIEFSSAASRKAINAHYRDSGGVWQKRKFGKMPKMKAEPRRTMTRAAYVVNKWQKENP